MYNLTHFFSTSCTFALLAAMVSCSGTSTEIKTRPNSVRLPASSIYDIQVVTLKGQPFNLSMLKGKKILIVNTASKCGNAPQYRDLQKLHIKYGDKIAILGFPCNDFGGQEFGAAEEISNFCKKNYGVSFQMFEKIVIKGSGKHALYKWLTDPAKNGWNSEAPSWNFCKYLINENGELIRYYASGIIPSEKDMGISEK